MTFSRSSGRPAPLRQARAFSLTGTEPATVCVAFGEAAQATDAVRKDPQRALRDPDGWLTPDGGCTGDVAVTRCESAWGAGIRYEVTGTCHESATAHNGAAENVWLGPFEFQSGCVPPVS